MKFRAPDLIANASSDLSGLDINKEAFEKDVYLERIKMLYSGMSTVFSATLIGMCTLTYVNWGLVNHSVLYTWFGYMVLILTYRVALSKLFHKNIELDHSRPQTWAKLYLAGSTLTAIGWGIAGSVLMTEHSLQQQMFTTILLAGLSAGALSTLSAVFTVYVLFLLFTMVPLTLTLYSFGGDIYIATGILVTLFIFFILSAARRMVKTINKTISLRFLHDAALKDIEKKKQQTDHLIVNLRQQIDERKIIEHHLESSMSQLKATLESATDGILVVNNHNIITDYNHNFIALFSVPDTLIDLNDFSQVEQHILSSLKDKNIESLTPVNDQLLLELNDGRLIEVYWNPQKIGDQVIGGVYSFRDVTDRINAESSLQRAKNTAEKANKEKSKFLSRISHELRTPLNAILGFGNLLREDRHQHLDNEERDHVSHICNAGDHLLHLIDDLLDISKIETGKLNIHMVSTPVKSIVDESLMLVRPAAEHHNITLELDEEISPDLYILADQTRCKQALVNLLSNAIKYNSKNGHVLLSITQKDTHIRFNVHDTGPGIEENNYDEIFQPFTRLKLTEKIQGTGIGLTITRRLIDVMNGTIGLESQPGKGSLFWFELPISTEDITISNTLSQKISDRRTTKMDRNHTILYIEDEPLNQALVRSIVKQIPDTELVTAMTGEEGIEVALKNQPDIILLDLNLPGISGFETFEVLKQEKTFSNTPVFAVSASAMPEEIERGREAGFYDYLIKPINIDNTRTLLNNVLANIDQSEEK